MMKLFKKTLLLFLAVVCMSGGILPVKAAEKYELKDLNLEMTPPSGWITFTRDISEDDPNLAALGLKKEDLINEYNSTNIYLNSINMSPLSEIVVTMVEYEDSNYSIDLNNLTDQQLQELTEYLGEIDFERLIGDNYTNISIYKNKEAVFLVLDAAVDIIDSILYSRQYVTLRDGQAINFIMNSFGNQLDSKQEQTLKQVVDSIHFTEQKAAPNKQADSSVQDKAAALDADKEYSYDLDGDGKKEKIKYVTSFNEDTQRTRVTLYINNVKKYTKTFEGLGAVYSIADIDHNDNKLDLFLVGWSDSNTMAFGKFQQYDEKIHTVKTILPDTALGNARISRLEENSGITGIKGDGTFTLTADTPIFIGEVGSYYAKIPMTLKNGKITAKKVTTYTLSGSSSKFSYTSKKKMEVYSSHSTKAFVSFQVKKGETIQILKLYIPQNYEKVKEGAYAYIKNSQGKKGWIYLPDQSQNTLFEEVPAWG